MFFILVVRRTTRPWRRVVVAPPMENLVVAQPMEKGGAPHHHNLAARTVKW